MVTAKRILFSFATVLTLAAAFSALPRPISARQQPPPKLVGKQINASGTISSVQQGALVLDVTKPKKDTLILFTDKNTTVEGDLTVGAKADVVYQKDDEGNLIAIKIHVNS